MAKARETQPIPAPSRRRARPGGRIGTHRVIDCLAQGGMGAVFRAREDGGAEVALKVPLPEGKGGSAKNRLKRFLREGRLTSRMAHPGVARVREQGQSDGLPFFTLDLVDGTPLSDVIFREDTLELAEAVRIVAAVARAAHHVHQRGVVHRDLKPSNILVRQDGEPVIIDFGLARDSLGIDPRITDSGIWVGTPAYLPPEQAFGEASRVDARADVYGLGAVLYECLTGEPPHGFGSPRAIFASLRTSKVAPPSAHRAVPLALDAVVMRALARDADDRYPTAAAFAEALDEVAALLPPSRGREPRPAGDAFDELFPSSAAAPLPFACGWNEEPARPSPPPKPRRRGPQPPRERARRTATSWGFAARCAALVGPALFAAAGALLLA